jgi:hypothetical protein
MNFGIRSLESDCHKIPTKQARIWPVSEFGIGPLESSDVQHCHQILASLAKVQHKWSESGY